MINLLPIPSMYDFIDLYGFTIDIPYMDAMGNIHSHKMGIYHKVRLGWEFKPEKAAPSILRPSRFLIKFQSLVR